MNKRNTLIVLIGLYSITFLPIYDAQSVNINSAKIITTNPCNILVNGTYSNLTGCIHVLLKMNDGSGDNQWEVQPTFFSNGTFESRISGTRGTIQLKAIMSSECLDARILVPIPPTAIQSGLEQVRCR